MTGKVLEMSRRHLHLAEAPRLLDLLREPGMHRQRVRGDDGHPNARRRHAQVLDPQDLARLVAELLLLVGLVEPVVDDRPRERKDVVGDRLGDIGSIRI